MSRKLIAAAGCFGFFFLVGFGLWAASPWFAGEREPWDAHFPYNAWWQIGFGLLGGAVAPRWLVRYVVGLVWLPCVIGQFTGLVMLAGEDNGWWALGLFTISGNSLYTVIGFLAGLALGWAVRTMRTRKKILPE